METEFTETTEEGIELSGGGIVSLEVFNASMKELASALLYQKYYVTDDLMWGTIPGLEGNWALEYTTTRICESAWYMEGLYEKIIEGIYAASDDLEYLDDIPAEWQGELIGYSNPYMNYDMQAPFPF